MLPIGAAVAEKSKQVRTVDVVTDELTMVKPSELIECTEMASLTLADRRTYNLLLLNAWDCIDEDKEHVITKKDLRGKHHTTERVRESLLRLMAVVCTAKVERNGKNFERHFHILEDADDENDEGDIGLLYYRFPAKLRTIIKKSTQFARLKKEIVFALSSKYALSLYELVSKRINLKHKKSEEIPIDKFRALLGVEEGKLPLFKSLRQRAIDPAVLEVNGLAEFGCSVEPIYTGKKVTAVKLSWWPKSLAEKMAALREVKGSKVGRKARLLGTVEKIVEPPAPLPAPKPEPRTAPAPVNYGRANGIGSLLLKTTTFEKARELAPGLDIYYLENEWREWAYSKGEPVQNPDGAFLNFIRMKAKQLNIG